MELLSLVGLCSGLDFCFLQQVQALVEALVVFLAIKLI